MAGRGDSRKHGPGSQRGPQAVRYSPEAIKVADKLLSKVKLRDVLLRSSHDEKRMASFRGKDLVAEILTQQISFEGITATDESKALAIAEKLFNCQPAEKLVRLFALVEPLTSGAGGKAEGKAKHEKKGSLNVVVPSKPLISVDGSAKFDGDKRYVCLYTPTNRMQYVYIALLVLVILAASTFKAWPVSARVVVWYISVTLLLALLGIIAVQFVVFGICWLAGFEVWILPNLWDDVESWSQVFVPLITAKKSESVAVWVRPLVIVLLLAFGAFVYSQTPDVNEFLAQQKQFVDDLYAGTLLGDGSETGAVGRAGPGFGYGQRKGVPIPDLEEFEKMFGDEPAATFTPSPSPGVDSTADGAPDIEAMLNAEM